MITRKPNRPVDRIDTPPDPMPTTLALWFRAPRLQTTIFVTNRAATATIVISGVYAARGSDEAPFKCTLTRCLHFVASQRLHLVATSSPIALLRCFTFTLRPCACDGAKLVFHGSAISAGRLKVTWRWTSPSFDVVAFCSPDVQAR